MARANLRTPSMPGMHYVQNGEIVMVYPAKADASLNLRNAVGPSWERCCSLCRPKKLASGSGRPSRIDPVVVDDEGPVIQQNPDVNGESRGASVAMPNRAVNCKLWCFRVPSTFQANLSTHGPLD